MYKKGDRVRYKNSVVYEIVEIDEKNKKYHLLSLGWLTEEELMSDCVKITTKT